MARLRMPHERRMRLMRPPRVKSLLALAGFAAAVLVVPAGTETTVANWSVSEYGSGTLKAFTVPPPIMSTCTLVPGDAGTNPVITVTWRFADLTAYSVPANVNYYVASGGLLQNLTAVFPLGNGVSTTGPVGGVYTTQFKSGILGGLLGGTYGVYLQTKDGSGWVSTLAAANASMGLAGTNPVCTVQ